MTTFPALPFRLDRVITIEARPDVVFSFFTDSARWAAWWGAGSSVEPRVGGRVLIRHANGVEVIGEILELASPTRIVFTYGYASGVPIAAGGSRVAIQLETVPDGTRLQLTHDFAERAPCDQHVQGWRYQLALFANLVADRVQANAAGVIDAWFQAWNEHDAAARLAVLGRLAAPDLQFRDRHGLIRGVEEMAGHLAAVRQHMPGMTLSRTGEVRHCQGRALSDWVATGTDGAPRGRGTNAFVFDADGRVRDVVGFSG
jgi:uncharacterized protein YndB with AHSA1/START domain